MKTQAIGRKILPMTPNRSTITPRRHAVPWLTVLLAAIHAVPLVLGWWLGWQWTLVGLMVVASGLTFCSLYPHCRVFGAATRRFPTERREVLLTIDDGPTEDTDEILQILASRGVRAVFFLIGDLAGRHPERVGRILAAGHLVGNHTQTHACYWWWIFSPLRQRREIGRCQQTLAAITGKPPALFRAPAGMRNPYCNAVAAEFGLEVTGWQARGFDGVEKSVEKVLSSLTRGLRPGAIVLIHQGLPHSLEVLQRTIEAFESNDLTPILPEAWLSPATVEKPRANC